MSSTNVALKDVTIPNGSNVSNIINYDSHDGADVILLYAPAALDALTFTIEVSADPKAVAGSAWVTLQVGDPAGDAAPPAAGKCRAYYELASAMSWRLKASGNVAADRVFKANKSEFI